MMQEGLVPRLVDGHGRLWATAHAGLEVYEAGSPVAVATIDLPSIRITGLIEDREGNIWARTFTAGLIRIRELPMQVIGMEHGHGGKIRPSFSPTPSGSPAGPSATC